MTTDTPLILFTGLPGAGVSTRMAALRPALGRDNGFKAYEVDKEGKTVGMEIANELELLDQMIPRGEASARAAKGVRQQSVFYLSVEAGGQKNGVQIWERSYHDAARMLEDLDFEGVVISLPIQIERDAVAEAQLDSLIRPLRRKNWIELKHGNVPWIIFDLTQYETLFSQLTPEMLTEWEPARFASSFATPYSIAMQRDIQEIAVRSFCQRWISDNELTHLANAERQRCSISYSDRPQQRSRVMVQVSSAWGFLAGEVGPSVRQPANFRHSGEAPGGLPSPRFPNLTEIERRILPAVKLSAEANLTWSGPNDKKGLEQTAERFFQAWRPIGIVEAVPTVVWKKPAPNMFWIPEMMSGLTSSMARASRSVKGS